MPVGLRNPTESEKALQDRLHDLITKLSQAMDHVKSWPEDKGDNSSVHMENARKLIEKIHLIISALKKVEGTVQRDPILQKSLQDCLIPTDLLDLMDHGGGLHPDCFVRGLFQEALGQLAGLKRRKLALQMLGNAVQVGIQQKKKRLEGSAAKRERTDEDEVSALPPKKKSRTNDE